MKHFTVNYGPLLPPDRNSAILDFGCGPGIVLDFLQKQGYQNLKGIDIYAHDRWKEPYFENIEFEQVDNSAGYLKSNQGKYDLIIVKDVIYYFKKEEAVTMVQLLKQALKPNGKIIFEIFNGATLTGPFVKYKDIDIELILTEHSIVGLIERGGLKLNVIKPNKVVITGLGSFVFKVVNTIETLLLKLMYFSERGIDDQNPRIFSRKIIVLASAV